HDALPISNGFIPKNFVKGPDGKDFRNENGDLIIYNAKKAAKYWEKAKKELGIKNLTIELLTFDTDGAKKQSEFIQGELEKNLPGLKVELKQQPFKQKLVLESNGEYQLSVAGWSPDYPDPMTFMDMFVTNGAHNQQNFSNKEYDQLIKDAKSTLLTDLPARWDALLKAEKILIEE